MLKKVQKDQDDENDRIRTAQEEAEQKKFERKLCSLKYNYLRSIFSGNRVTVESFNEWREKFEREFFAAEREAKKVRIF